RRSDILELHCLGELPLPRKSVVVGHRLVDDVADIALWSEDHRGSAVEVERGISRTALHLSTLRDFRHQVEQHLAVGTDATRRAHGLDAGRLDLISIQCGIAGYCAPEGSDVLGISNEAAERARLAQQLVSSGRAAGISGEAQSGETQPGFGGGRHSSASSDMVSTLRAKIRRRANASIRASR